MAYEPETTEDLERPLKALANGDLIEEIKTRIVNGELKEALLFDTCTSRMYSDLGKEERRLFPLDAVLSLLYLQPANLPRQQPWPRFLTGRCLASEPCCMTTFPSEAAPSLFIVPNS